MAFDAKEYRNRVLSPYARAREPILRKALGELKQSPQLKVPSQFDLAEFYAISVATNDADAAAQVSAVASAIKGWVQRPGGSRQPLELHELIATRNPDLKTASFWSAVQRMHAQRSAQELAEFGKIAESEFSSLGVVTAAQLREAAKGSGVPDSVSDDDLARIVQSEGISVVAELPAVNAPAQVLKEITGGLKRTSARSVLSAIFLESGEPSTFAILDGFRTSVGTYSLSVETVASAYSFAQRLPDTDENDAFAKILAALRNTATSDASLSDIVVAHFIDLGRQTFKELASRRGALKAFVERTGIDPIDAGRILLTVAPAGSAPQRGYPEVRSLTAAGSLKEARRLYLTVFAESSGSETDAQKQALTALQGAEQRVDELRRRAGDAQTRGDLETATKALNEALTLCSDDETLAAAARALPPAAPIRLVASISEDAHTAKLSWEPGFGSSEDVRYQVLRKTGSAPRNNTDGTVIGTGIQPTFFEDPRPPVAVVTFYGVSASRGGGASPVAVADALALPPVTEVAVTSDPTSVTLRWRTPPEASTIEIVQVAPDGSKSALRAGTQSGTTSTGLRTGATYTYLLTAVYTGASGARLTSTTVRVTGVPRGMPAPVAAISIAATGGGSHPEVAVEWRAVAGYPVEIWHYAHKPEWVPGARLAMTEIRGRGAHLAGSSLADSGREGVRGATDQGLRHYVAITRDGDFGLVGAIQPHGSAPVVQNVRAQRFGDEVVVSWDWPGPEYEVRVRWAGAAAGERTIAMNEYRSEGGCRVPMGAGGGEVSIASVAGEDATRWLSSETTLAVEGSTAAFEYDVEFRRRMFGPPSAAVVVFLMPESASAFDVVVVAHFNKFMPFDASQGSVLTRTVVSAASPRIELDLPRAGKGTVWVRAFATSSAVRLIDPPPARMKVD